MNQSIGEKIIATIDENRLVDDYWREGRFTWEPDAATRLTALVEQHIEEQIRLKLGHYTIKVLAPMPEFNPNHGTMPD